MPKPKSASSILGVGRGVYRKAFLSLLLQKYSQKNALAMAKIELGEKCVYCGISGKDVLLQGDHLWPQEIGGIHIVGNVVPACPTCNSDRGSQDWMIFIRKKVQNQQVLQEKIQMISEYMKRHSVERIPTLENYLNKEEFKLRADLDMILDAISQGLRAKTGNPQKKEVKFYHTDQMFDKIVTIANSHLLNSITNEEG